MNLTEILKAKGIADDVIKSIADDMKANKIFTAGEENLDIRYGKLKGEHEETGRKLNEANNRIGELERAANSQGDIQKKLADFESRNAALQAELEKTKLEAEIKVGLLAADCLDVDYAAFKLREKGELALDENGKIKGWEDKLAGLKVQLPNQFKSAETKKIIENKLPTGDTGNTVSKEAFGKMGYQDRLKLYNENPEAYRELSKN